MGGGEGGLTKIFKNFVYQPILMKFDTKRFFGLLKTNPWLIFRNSEKGPLRRGGEPKNLKNFVNQPNLMKFGTIWFFGLLKPNPQ